MSGGMNRIGNCQYPRNMASQTAMPTMAQLPAAKNKGRKV